MLSWTNTDGSQISPELQGGFSIKDFFLKRKKKKQTKQNSQQKETKFNGVFRFQVKQIKKKKKKQN